LQTASFTTVTKSSSAPLAPLARFARRTAKLARARTFPPRNAPLLSIELVPLTLKSLIFNDLLDSIESLSEK
jgi:hypothetical protein